MTSVLAELVDLAPYAEYALYVGSMMLISRN